MKPRIQFINAQWCCHDNFYIFGYGATPLLAFHDWKHQEARRTCIPRRGMWNKDACRRWYRRGCPTIRFYIGKLQIVSYDYTTDELILRG